MSILKRSFWNCVDRHGSPWHSRWRETRSAGRRRWAGLRTCLICLPVLLSVSPLFFPATAHTDGFLPWLSLSQFETVSLLSRSSYLPHGWWGGWGGESLIIYLKSLSRSLGLWSSLPTYRLILISLTHHLKWQATFSTTSPLPTELLHLLISQITQLIRTLLILYLLHKLKYKSIQGSTAQKCNTYHCVPTVGSSTSTSANDFVYAFFVDGCVAFWRKNAKIKEISFTLSQFISTSWLMTVARGNDSIAKCILKTMHFTIESIMLNDDTRQTKRAKWKHLRLHL